MGSLVLGVFRSSAVAVQAATGLIFPSNGDADSDVRFKFTGANLLSAFPATYIWRVKTVQQTGYYTTFFWGPDGAFTGAGYYGAHPYPKSGTSQGTTHDYEVSIDGADYVTDDNANDPTVVHDTWRTQALIVREVAGSELEAKFYWDLDVDVGRVITYPGGNSDYATSFPPASPALTFGGAPWGVVGGQNTECLSGTLRGIQVYADDLSLSDIQAEIASPKSTAAGLASIWYLKLNPTPDDIADDSGAGHDPAWANANRPTLYEG